MIGTRLGQYRIDALLGQGGMGAVYLATDEMLGRQVAIKVLREQADSKANATERFRSEAQILSRLDHPHILRLHGFSEHEGVLYMVTEFVKGEALQRRLERGAVLDPRRVLEWATQVLDALDYAHQLGVVHRDIKPANILIDERDRARLLDFGIARIVGTDGPTQTGHAVGTLTYMAPEQVLEEPIDGRADIYAFAVVLCQVFAGRWPYRATTTAGLIREIVDGPPPDVAALLPPQAAAFAPALLRALARYPTDRTPTAARMRLELLAAADGPALPPLPVTQQPDVPAPTDATPLTLAPVPVPLAFPSEAVVASAGGPATVTDRTMPVPPPIRRREPGAIAYVLPALLLLSGVAVAWYLLAPTRLVTPRVAMASAESTPQPVASVNVQTSSDGSSPSKAIETPSEVTAPPAPAHTTAPTTASAGRLASARPATPATRAAVTPPAQSPEAGEPEPVAPPPPTPVAEAASAPTPAPAAPAAASVPATIEFKDIILMDRVDDEDEELDVSMRLDARRVVVLDEDGLAKRSIAYEAIDRASYNTKKPGRFSLRRGSSHWLTLEVGTTPVVLRLNSRTYEQVLTTLAGHGVSVERNP